MPTVDTSTLSVRELQRADGRSIRLPLPPRGRSVIAAVAPNWDDDVLRMGFAHARTTGARLVVCAVVESEPECFVASERLAERVRHLLPHDARDELDCRVGDPAEQILACVAAHDTSLVVVGEASRREGLLARMFWPSVPTKILRGTAAPILVSRRTQGTGRILAATALGDSASPVLEATAAEVARAGGKVTVLHCLEPMVVLASAEAPTMLVAATDDMEAVAEEQLRKAARNAGLANAKVKVEVASPAEKILEMAQELDVELIVVATHGRRGAARLLLGSVAEEVVRDATCNVMVVHLEQDEEVVAPAGVLVREV